MSMQHHPAEELLLDYAAGASDEATSLILATHLALCPQCRRTVGQAEAAGGALLATAKPEALSSGALESVLARLSDTVTEPAAPKLTAIGKAEAPEPLRSYIGGDLDSVKWRRIAGGISYADLPVRGKSKARLIRSEPGAGVGVHSHKGNELTLCLTGGYTDVTGTYARGDIQTTDPTVEHRPLADPEGPCITLGVTDAPLVFRSRVIGLLAKVFGF
ncbi:MAG TPA: ChrR family anti-sigma-E factor [Rhizomicrobium sp.]|nr:ChrR family anti-sigma-E factor [Rhizomicrobium sp.]